jgi:plastocyanin
MRRLTAVWIVLTALSWILLSDAGPSFAVEPGVDVAAPRVAISQVNDGITFMPANLVIEQGDWVRWMHVGASLSHTTTSGNPCVGSGLWNFSLVPGTQFTRQFLEIPQNLPYFCTPHCTFGMQGQVAVTTRIAVQASDNLGQLVLNWTGGSGVYQVFRSDVPAFTGAGTTTLSPDAGPNGTTFTDPTPPTVGKILFYLVMNKF